MRVAIVDYGLGNIRSAEQSLKKVIDENNIDAEVAITNNAKDIYLASHIILPGQGAFKTCMEGLKNITGMIDALSQNVLIQKKYNHILSNKEIKNIFFATPPSKNYNLVKLALLNKKNIFY